jgi:hypothetical protein
LASTGHPAESQYGQISRDDDLSRELLCGQVAPRVVGNSIDAGRQVREDKCFDPSFSSNAAYVFDWPE